MDAPVDVPSEFLPEDTERFERLAELMREEVADDSSGHALDHAWRVFALGLRLADAEGADPEVVGAAALVHDLHRSMGDGYTHPEESLPRVRELLDAAGVPAEQVPEICHCVAVHDGYGFDYGPDCDDPETAEAEVLRDADNLDAIGAVGLARTFAYGGARGNPIGRPGDRPADGTTVGHFHEKLLRLGEDMHTDRGRELAAERTAFLETFLHRFAAEWQGQA
ncbi:HD domain-containing protein [Halomicrobium salinisoli]|uniref:HD domain-containing protein n=1 Tax=Halomicrobium salinisoli TaxID=2878391 RepID=UPI001CF0269E|nr:HD domain-containing protein [Halomicrobium salinisoli]